MVCCGVSNVPNDRLRAPGTCPPRNPARGSGTRAWNRSAERASSINSRRDCTFSRTSLSPAAAACDSAARNRRRCNPRAARRLARRALRRATSAIRRRARRPASWPNSRSIHQARGAEKMPCWSSQTMRLELPTPSSPICCFELTGCRHHVRQLRVPIGNQVDVEEARAGNVRLRVQREGLPCVGRHVPARIEQHQVRRGQLARKPLGTDQGIHGSSSTQRGHRGKSATGAAGRG